MTELVREFLTASTRERDRELEEQRERARQAESRSMAAESIRLRLEEPGESLNVAGQAWQRAPSSEALRALAGWYETHAHLVGVWSSVERRRGERADGLPVPIADLSIDEAGERLVSCEFQTALVAGEPPAQLLITQSLRDLGRTDTMTDSEGLGGCAWAGDKLVVLRRGQILTYRYDLFRDKFRQSTTGVAAPATTATLLANPTGEYVAIAGDADSVGIYAVHTDRLALLPTDGRCTEAAWLGERTLLVVEDGGLTRRALDDWGSAEALLPRGSGIKSVTARGREWVALSFGDHAVLHRPSAGGVSQVVLAEAPDPAIGVRLGPSGTAFVYGGGARAGGPSLTEVDTETGQRVRDWLGGDVTAVTAFDAGQERWLAAGSRDGSVLLWDRDRTALDTEKAEALNDRAPVEAELRLQAGSDGYDVAEVEVSLPGRPVMATSRPVLSEDLGLWPGRIPAAAQEDTVGIGYGADMVWFDIDGNTLREAARGAAHSNPIAHVASSHSNRLWASAAMAYRNNSPLELFVWDPNHAARADAILRLDLPLVDLTDLAFDESGEVLLLLNDHTVVRRLAMDPDLWVENARRLQSLEWSPRSTPLR